MTSSPRIQWLKEDHDIEGLVRALRHPIDPILRAEAAKALAELDDLEAVEYLIRSTLEDPDSGVQKAARSALEDLIGAEANQAISSYRSGPPDPDPWLQDSLAEPTRKESAMDGLPSPVQQSFKIRSLKADGDLDGLVGWLRDPMDPMVREEAALALGELGNLDVTESLIRSHLEDPNEEVRKIARQALESLVGSQTDLAIAAYRSGPVETDPWLVDYSDHAEEESDDEENWEEMAGDDLMENLAAEGDELRPELEVDPERAQWDRQNLDGLIAVLRNENDPTLRLRAIQALQHSSNIHAISFLAQTALYNDDPDLRAAAQSALEARFGDDAPGIIEGYREADLNKELLADEDEEVDEEEEEPEESGSPFQQSPSFQEYPQPQVIREDAMNWRLILAAGLVVLGVAAIILLLALH